MNPITRHRLEQGGTLLGFVAGLLVGLGVALAIAVYVTKAPIPLMDREVQRPSSTPAIEAERLRNWNPNASLSNQPAAPPAPVTPTPAAVPPAASAPADDPIAQLMEQRASTAPAGVAAVEAPPLIDPFIYFVQVGAFRQATEAEAQRARLAMLGFEASVSEREQAGQQVFRVRIGPLDRRLDAELMEQRVLGNGFETTLVRVQR